MELIWIFIESFIRQIQAPVLAFLIGGMVLSALNTKLRIPDAIYQFCVFMLLMRIGLDAGMAIRGANIVDLLIPAIICVIIGIVIIFIGSITLAQLPGIRKDDAFATIGLFGAVSGATMLAGMMALEDAGIGFEPWIAALYPFMDIPALVMAIIFAKVYIESKDKNSKIAIWPIIKECLQGTTISTLILGVLLGLFTKPDIVFVEFYDLLFRGFLSLLMLTLGIEAYKRLKELIKVAHWYVAYAFIAPIIHGLIGFGLGYVAHLIMGLSPGGVIMLAIIAASNSDVSGPPAIRGGIPTANPSAYIGTSTGIGTAVAISICIPLFITLGTTVFGL